MRQCGCRGHRPRQTGCAGKGVCRRSRCEYVRYRHLYKQLVSYRAHQSGRLAQPDLRGDGEWQSQDHGRMRIQRGLQAQGGIRALLRRGFPPRYALRQTESAHRRADRVRQLVGHRCRSRGREQVGHHHQRSFLGNHGRHRIFRSRERRVDRANRDRGFRQRKARTGHRYRGQFRG